MPYALRPDCPNKPNLHAIFGPPSIPLVVQPIVYPCLHSRLRRMIVSVECGKRVRTPVPGSVIA